MNPPLPGARRCRATGLTLVPATGQNAWRIAKSARGPLHPPLRPASTHRSGWGRFDATGRRTAYLASTRECAYAEVLAYLRRNLSSGDPLAKDAAALGMSVAQFVAEVESDWATSGHMPPGHLPRGWRSERLLYELNLPSAGHWVDLATPDSLAAAESALPDQLAATGVTTLDLGVLHGTNREATTAIAAWVSSQTLDDGTSPLGIVYESKHATGLAWAHWLPSAPTLRGITERASEPITGEDGDLLTVARRFGITVW